MAARVYEHCQRFMRTNRPDVLDDLLEITLTEIPTQRVLRRARFYVRADEATSRWIEKHPTFSRGCWPVGLFTLHDWMWEKKFIDVETKEIVEGGTVDPRVGTTFIRAELENFEEGVWLAPLVNFANTHLFDQLRQFYVDSPEAKAAPDRIPQIMAAEKAKAAAKQRATAVAQFQRQHLLKAPVNHVRVFVDESGDIGFKQIDDVYVVAPVIIPHKRYGKVKKAIDSLRTKHWRSTPPVEIHMSKIAEPKRTEVKSALAKIILDNEVTIIGCAIDKRAFIKHLFRCHAASRRSEEYPLNLTWIELINDREYFLQANTLATTVELVIMHLALDFLTSGTSAIFTHDRKHRQWMNDSLTTGFKRGLSEARKLSQAFFGLEVVPSVRFNVADSKDEPCLWLSDWISGELRAWRNNIPFSPAFESIRSNISFLAFRDDGVKCASKEIGGRADREFPDLPRRLAKRQIFNEGSDS